MQLSQNGVTSEQLSLIPVALRGTLKSRRAQVGALRRRLVRREAEAILVSVRSFSESVYEADVVTLVIYRVTE